jgi:hypothetical protein
VTTFDFFPETAGTLGGTCLTAPGVPTAAAPCTVTVTVSAAALGIKPGASLNSVTGFSTYFFGSSEFILLGNSEHADATAALDYTGTGTTTTK